MVMSFNKRGIWKYLPEFVYGGIDGSVTTFAVVAGAMGASFSSTIILILGFANLFADGVSMALSNYDSNKSDRELHSRTKFEKTSTKSALATFISFLIVGFIPLLFFVLALFFPVLLKNAFLFSIILTALAFLFVGSVKGIVTGKHPIQSALETLFIGAIASSLAFLVGYILKNVIH